MSQICYRVTNLLLYYRNGVIEYRTGRAYTPGELDRRIHSPQKESRETAAFTFRMTFRPGAPGARTGGEAGAGTSEDA